MTNKRRNKSAKKKSTAKKKKPAARGAKAKSARAKSTKAKRAPKRQAKAKASPKPIKRRDATGHLDPSYERDLRRKSEENAEKDDDRGFLVGKNKNDALAEELGREFVETVTSGEDEGNEVRDQFVSEEVGGPFVNTTRGQEIDEKPDESNPPGATREPFPKAN